MIHEQSSTIIADIIVFIAIILAYGWVFAIVLGKFSIRDKLRGLDTFEIARSTPIYEPQEWVVTEEVAKTTTPKKKQAKEPVHPMYQDCVLALMGVGVSNAEARKTARITLKVNPDIDSVEEFLTFQFRKNE